MATKLAKERWNGDSSTFDSPVTRDVPTIPRRMLQPFPFTQRIVGFGRLLGGSRCASISYGFLSISSESTWHGRRDSDTRVSRPRWPLATQKQAPNTTWSDAGALQNTFGGSPTKGRTGDPVRAAERRRRDEEEADRRVGGTNGPWTSVVDRGRTGLEIERTGTRSYASHVLCLAISSLDAAGSVVFLGVGRVGETASRRVELFSDTIADSFRSLVPTLVFDSVSPATGRDGSPKKGGGGGKGTWGRPGDELQDMEEFKEDE